jgi:LPXTG-site transpeptidase (sortase) family protein
VTEESHDGPSRARAWRSVSGAAAAVTVAALVALAVWVAGRPGDSAGADLSQVRGTSPTPTASASPSRAPRSLPEATVTEGSLEALDGSAASPPARLVIPDLDVDAGVDAVGVQEDGAMVIPAARTRVGWYRYGSAPDDAEGNTVIAGHVATPQGPGALAALRGAKTGMRVTVTTADGTEREYEITGREAIVKKALPVEEIFARDGRPLLVLITCGGEYIRELRSHRDNIVVTATPVG